MIEIHIDVKVGNNDWLLSDGDMSNNRLETYMSFESYIADEDRDGMVEALREFE